MKLETFFEKFELFADAPGGVESLRESVLELAVRGRLSSREPEDRDRDWLALAAQLDKEATPANSERPFEIPKDWRWSTLEALGDTKPRNDAAEAAECGFVPMTLIAEEYGRPARHEARTWNEVMKGYTHIRDGDVVLAKITPCFQNGKSAVMSGLPGGMGAGTTELHVFRANQQAVLPEFVLLFIKSRGFLRRGVPRMTGSAGQKRVPHDYFARSPFPLPPPAEQRRIVAKVGELMVQCDRLASQQQHRETRHVALAQASLARFASTPTPANLNFLFHDSYAIEPADLRKSILAMAVRGRLLVQNPSDEPGAHLLARIRGSLGRQSPTNDEPAGPERPFDLPLGWTWARFQDLGQLGRGRSKHRPRNDRSLFVGGTHRLVQTGDVARANGTILTHTGLYNDAGLAQSKLWPAGTLCITIAANIADSGILGFPACFPDSVVGFVPADPIPSVRYFEYFMRTAKERLEEFAPATAQRNINLRILEQVWIPIPPAAEQSRIVARVDQLMSLIDQLEGQLSSSHAAGESLGAAIVAELTPATHMRRPHRC